MKKIFVIFLMIGLLAVFPNSSVLGNIYADNLIQETTNSLSYENNNSLSYEYSKSVLLNLHETLNLQHDSSNYNSKSLPTNVNYKISLVDNLHIDSDDKKFNHLLLVSNPYDKIKLISRIKLNEQKNIFSSDDYLISNPLSITDSQYFDDQLAINNEFNLLSSTFNYLIDNTITKNTIIHEIFKFEQLSQNFDGNLVFVFIPFIGFLFFKLEYGKISIARSKSSLSSFVIILLVFSAFSSPFTISFNYYGSAYAEEFSFSGIIDDDLTNHLNSNSNNGVKVTIEPLSPPIVLDNSTDSNTELVIDASAEPIINSTSTDLVNATTTESIINSTSTDLVNATTTESIINSTSTDLVNATTTEPIIEPTENILSTELDSLQTELTETEILTNQTSSSIKLDGNDDFVIIENQTSTDNLAELTISSWVKPDYSQGSQEFTVISKDNSFVLSINNLITPTKIAKFSVFDGIKWTSVESTSIIDEKWTQLSATFNGTSIQIYVDGQLESTNTLEDQLTLSVNGKLITTTIDSLSSESDIVIGAYVNTRKGSEQISQEFSGQVDGVSLFNSQLDNSQIKSLYDEKSEYYMSQDSVEIDLDTILAEITAEQSINSTSTEPTEIIVTELIVNATLDSVKESYVITENAKLTLEFYDEHDVLTNELEELENSLLLLSELEQELEKPIIANTTATEPTDDGQLKTDIANTKGQILLLKEKIDSIKANKEINEHDTEEAKLQLKSILTELDQNTNSLSQNNDEMTQQIQNSTDNIEEIGDVAPEDMIQENIWTGNEEQITTDVYDAQGNIVDLKANYEKIRDGKFEINLDFDSNDKPGIYKVKTTLLVNGETHVVESEFAWGLISLNTKKSTYKPGETAEFVIVVLDNQGHPIGDATLSMDIINPNSQITHLSSGNGIITGDEKGLYDAEFVTGGEGVYTVDINAQANGIDTNFSTTFTVKSFVEYDIIRIAQSKIDPVTNPNSFDVRINIESFVGSDPLEIVEYIPDSFEIITDGKIKQVGDRKTITWNKELIDRKTEVSYSYSVPLVFPDLYALGPIEISDVQGQTFTEARSWFVANDPAIPQNRGGVLAYADTVTVGTPKYRIFDGSTFVAEGSASSVGSSAISWIRVAASPTQDQWIIATRDAANVIKAQVCTGNTNGITCGAPTSVATSAGAFDFRNFDVEYEKLSGEAILVYGTATADELRYMRFDGTSWITNSTITTTNTAGTIEWVEMESDPNSDKIGLAWSDTGDDLDAQVWSGSAWGNAPASALTTALSTVNVRKFDVSWEGSSGDFIVANQLDQTSTTTLEINQMTTAGTWSAATQAGYTQLPVVIDLSSPVTGTDVISAAWQEGNTNVNSGDYEGGTWSGTAMTDNHAGDATGEEFAASRFLAGASYLNSTNPGIMVYSDADTNVSYFTSNTATTWALKTDATPSTARGVQEQLRVYDFPTADKILVVAADANSDLWVDTWDGTTWVTPVDNTFIENSLSSITTMPFDFAFRLYANQQALSENLGMTDAVSATVTKNILLTENLGMTDAISATVTKNILLTENLGMTDAVSATVTKNILLTENLGMTDAVSSTRSRTIPLTENLGMTDAISATRSRTIQLTENLGMTDAVSATRSRTIPLTE
ncbi:MAG: hypothetical protein EPO37_07285, partial [Nitrosarchaeum sp.]